jgi:hypothetical protein
MSSKEETAAITARLAKAISERDSWKASGIQEKYLAAYTLVEALELLREQQNQQSKVESAQMLPDPANFLRQPQGEISEGDLPDEAAQRVRIMRELSIGFNGRYYHYRGYRYDRLSDAVNYARLQRSRSCGGDSDHAGLVDEEQKQSPGEIVPPSESDLAVMDSLAITFRNGTYFFGPYRYDRLADAVQYARLTSR